MKIILSMTALALLFVLANCDKKKEGDMPADATTTQEAPAATEATEEAPAAEDSKE